MAAKKRAPGATPRRVRPVSKPATDDPPLFCPNCAQSLSSLDFFCPACGTVFSAHEEE